MEKIRLRNPTHVVFVTAHFSGPLDAELRISAAEF
jgi:hypothetical protein